MLQEQKRDHGGSTFACDGQGRLHKGKGVNTGPLKDESKEGGVQAGDGTG